MLLTRFGVDLGHNLIEVGNLLDGVNPKLVIQLVIGSENEFVNELGDDEDVWDEGEG